MPSGYLYQSTWKPSNQWTVWYTSLLHLLQYFGCFSLILTEWLIYFLCPYTNAGCGWIDTLTSLVSSFTGRKVKSDLAMTGEITLRGKVLAVGGIKEKILAAKRSGIKEIILCKDNQKDIAEINKKYLKGLKFHYVDNMNEVIDIALLKTKVRNPYIA